MLKQKQKQTNKQKQKNCGLFCILNIKTWVESYIVNQQDGKGAKEVERGYQFFSEGYVTGPD